MTKGWLVVFAKAPRPGLVKTRMCPPLDLEACAALYREMLGDVLAASARFAARLDLEPIIALHPPDATHEILADVPPGYRVHAQRGEGLGERMAYAAREAFAAGARRVLIRGSDSPALPFECFEEVTQRLDTGADVVWTPDQGGGYALVGMRDTNPRLFEIPMSTHRVLEQTVDAARSLGLSVATTRPGFDLDTVGDLQLFETLSARETADLCPRTVQFLSTIPGTRVL